MLVETEAVVLRRQPYRETSLLVGLYTLSHGRLDGIVKGANSSRGRKAHGYYQPLSLLQVQLYYKEQRSLQNITHSTFSRFYLTLDQHPLKQSYAMLMLEVFAKAVKEEAPNEPLFAFLTQRLLALDAAERGFFPLVASFLLELTYFLGCYPALEAEPEAPKAFHLESGVLANALPGEPTDPVAEALYALGTAPPGGVAAVQIPKMHRPALLRCLQHYYSLHHLELGELHSLRILEAVFR